MNLFALTVVIACSAISVFAEATKNAPGVVRVIECAGTVTGSSDGKEWHHILRNAELPEGTFLRTQPGATADLLLQYNGSVFRLSENSELRVEQLSKVDTGVGMVTETRLNVFRGRLVGSQRKLQKPSILEIETPQGTALIRGTEYVVNSAGAVTVLSGAVEVTYNLPGNKGAVKVTVAAGYTFDPATRTVVPTNAGHLQNVIADVDAVKANAETFKTGGATIIVKPSGVSSPTKGNNGVGNGQDPQPPGNPPVNDGSGTGPGNPGNGNGSPGNGKK